MVIVLFSFSIRCTSSELTSLGCWLSECFEMSEGNFSKMNSLDVPWGFQMSVMEVMDKIWSVSKVGLW